MGVSSPAQAAGRRLEMLERELNMDSEEEEAGWFLEGEDDADDEDYSEEEEESSEEDEADADEGELKHGQSYNSGYFSYYPTASSYGYGGGYGNYGNYGGNLLGYGGSLYPSYVYNTGYGLPASSYVLPTYGGYTNTASGYAFGRKLDTEAEAKKHHHGKPGGWSYGGYGGYGSYPYYGYGGGYGGYGGGYGGGYYGGYNNNKPSAGALGPIIGAGLAGLAGLAGFGAVNPTTTVTPT